MPDIRSQANPDRRENFAGTFFFMLIGPIVWVIHLTVVYGTHAIFCARGPSDDGIFAVIFVIAAATGSALAVLVAAMIVAYLRYGKTEGRTAATSSLQYCIMGVLSLLSAIGVAWGGGTALVVPACLMLR